MGTLLHKSMAVKLE